LVHEKFTLKLFSFQNYLIIFTQTNGSTLTLLKRQKKERQNDNEQMFHLVS